MLTRTLSILSLSMLAATALLAPARAQSAADFSGTYHCTTDPRPCSDQTLTVTQSGSTLDVKGDSGSIGQGKVTSDVSLSMGPTWNMLGVVLPDKSIQWSNGTKWQKQ